MRIRAELEGELDAWIAAELAAAEMAVTAGVRAAAAGLKDRWRGQIAGAGLGPRLARTIRQRDFPVGEPSLKAASLVYSRAATIVHAFDQGVTIRSKRGSSSRSRPRPRGSGARAESGSPRAAGSGGPACACASSIAAAARACWWQTMRA